MCILRLNGFHTFLTRSPLTCRVKFCTKSIVTLPCLTSFLSPTRMLKWIGRMSLRKKERRSVILMCLFFYYLPWRMIDFIIFKKNIHAKEGSQFSPIRVTVTKRLKEKHHSLNSSVLLYVSRTHPSYLLKFLFNEW